MKMILAFALLIGLTACPSDEDNTSTGNNVGILTDQNTGLWASSTDLDGLDDVEFFARSGENPEEACSLFLVEDEKNSTDEFYQIESLEIKKSGLILPVFANKYGVFEAGVKYSVGNILTSGELKYRKPIEPLSVDTPGKKPETSERSTTIVDFTSSNKMTMVTTYHFAPLSDKTPVEVKSTFIKISDEKLEAFNDLLSNFCRKNEDEENKP